MCEKCYKTKSHLAVHFRSHSGSRPYACDFCALTFAHNKVIDIKANKLNSHFARNGNTNYN